MSTARDRALWLAARIYEGQRYGGAYAEPESVRAEFAADDESNAALATAVTAVDREHPPVRPAERHAIARKGAEAERAAIVWMARGVADGYRDAEKPESADALDDFAEQIGRAVPHATERARLVEAVCAAAMHLHAANVERAPLMSGLRLALTAACDALAAHDAKEQR